MLGDCKLSWLSAVANFDNKEQELGKLLENEVFTWERRSQPTLQYLVGCAEIDNLLISKGKY